MSDSILNIIINTVKRGGGDKEAINNLVKMKTQFKELTGINLSSLTAYAAVGAAVAKIADFTKKAIDSNTKYITTIQDIVRLTGLQAEEASRLFQVTDDLFIKGEKFTQAMQYAIRNGFEPTIENLGKTADEYNALPTAADKARFAMELFGKKAGPDMQKLLEQGSAAIKARMDAVDQSLVVDDEAIQLTQEYKESVDNLNDAFAGVEYRVARKVIPILTDLNIIYAYLITKSGELEVQNKGLNETLMLLLTMSVYPLIKYYEVLAKGIGWVADKIKLLNPELAKSQEELDREAQAAAEVEKAMLDAAVATTNLLTKFTNIKGPADAVDVSLGMIGDSLREMGSTGEEAYREILIGMGKISPAAVKAMVETEAVIQRIKDMTANGFSMQFIIDYVIRTTTAWNTFGYGGATVAPGSFNEALLQGGINSNNGGSSPTSSSGSGWQLKGTKGGPGTDKAWYNGSSWYYGDKPPGAATGGLVKVGEQGTEIVKLPDGAFVYNHEQTQQMLGGGVNNVTFNISGAGDPKRVADEVVRRLNIQSVGRFK
jgi:hypothetical protein